MIEGNRKVGAMALKRIPLDQAMLDRVADEPVGDILAAKPSLDSDRANRLVFDVSEVD
jgi:hypothetical protein